MALKDQKFLLVVVTLLILASCSKAPVAPSNTGSSTGNTKQAEEQLLNDINQVVDSVATGSTGAMLPPPDSAVINGTGTTVVPDRKQVQIAEPQDLLKIAPGLDPAASTKTEGTTKVVKLSQKYKDPAGESEVEFTVSLNGKKIQSVTIKSISGSEVAKKMASAFGDAVNGAIGGKTITEAKSITAVGGASLTTQAFVSAIKNM